MGLTLSLLYSQNSINTLLTYSKISEARAGAEPVPYKSLTVDKLAEGIKQIMTDEARIEAEKIAASIEAEGDGAKNAGT